MGKDRHFIRSKAFLSFARSPGLMRRDKDRKALPIDPGHTRLPIWSEPPTDLAPRLEIPYSSDPSCKKGTSWNKIAMVSDSFLRAPTESGSNDLRRAGPRATCPSSQHTALNPCSRNASLKQKSLQVPLPWPLPTTESSVQRPEARGWACSGGLRAELGFLLQS